MADNISVSTAVDDEIAAMRNRLQERQMRLIADTYEINDESKNGQLDLDDEDTFARSGLEDAKLMQRMQDARDQYRLHLDEMKKIPDIMHLRSNYTDHISTMSNEITVLNNFYNENHEALNRPLRVFKKLIEIIGLVKFRKFDSVESELESCVGLLKKLQDTCDMTLRQIKKTQDNLFVLRRNIDKNCEDMLRSVAAHKEQVNALSAIKR
jgi:hypothetical protein